MTLFSRESHWRVSLESLSVKLTACKDKETLLDAGRENLAHHLKVLSLNIL